MTTIEKEAYLLQQLANCTDTQKQTARRVMHQTETYNLFPTDKDFHKWVVDTKKQFESEATPEEISAVFNHLRV